jgi:pimeloyl-ACP methyl ester carboxylesterase
MKIIKGFLVGAFLVVAGLVGFTGFMAWQAEREVPPDGRFIEIDGQRLHYLDQGAGPVILMIPGLASNVRHFSYALMGLLDKQFRVIAVDRPGSGYSTRANGAPADLRAQATTLIKFLDALKLDHPLVVGHSLGGGVALAMAEEAPDKISGLALIAPFTNGANEAPEPFRGLVITSPLKREIIAWTIATPMTLLNAKGLAEVFAPEPVPGDFATRGGGALSLRPSNFYAASADLVAADADIPEMVKAYPKLAMPVGVLFARDDAILDYRAQGEALKRELPATELVLLEHGGHMLPFTEPGPTAQFIRAMAERAFRQAR